MSEFIRTELPTILIVIAVLVLGAVLLLVRAAKVQDLASRVSAVGGGEAAALGAGPTHLATRVLSGLGSFVARRTRLFSEKELEKFSNMLAYAGFNGKRNLPALIGTKVVLTVTVPALAWGGCVLAGIGGTNMEMILLVAVVLGLRGAQIVLGLMAGPYVRAVRRGIPDALDLLVISVEAGLGLEAALVRVAKEMARSNRPAAMQLAALAENLRIMPDRKLVFENLRARGSDDGMARFGAVLSQSMDFGTPLAQALRAIADELRRQRVIMLEERGNRLPVLLVLPLVLFIMPCVVIVMVGPSALTLMKAMAHMGAGIALK